MSQEQMGEQPKSARKPKVLAAAALTGFLGISLATGYIIDSRTNDGFARRSVMNAVGLKKFKLQVGNPSAFPYQFSPWERYAQIEETMLGEFGISEKKIPRQTQRIISTANQISDNVAKRMLKAMDTYDVGDVSKGATSESVMNVIADEIANAGVFYTAEIFLSNSFNPAIHEKGKIHLDCKLITYLMCHVARRLNLETYIVVGANHMYLFVASGHDSGKGYVIEPTEFRKIEHGEGYVNYAGEGIGEGFFSTFERQKTHAGLVTTKRFEEAAGLHVTITDTKQIEDDMRANIIVGLLDYARREEDTDLQVRIYNKLFGMAEKGSKSYLVISNAFSVSLNLAEKLMKEKRYKDAETLLKNAAWIRSAKNELIVNQEPIEEILLGKLYWEIGDKHKALRQLREANGLYGSRGLFYFRGDESRPVALNRHHCLLLRYLATAELDHGTMPLPRIYNELVLPAYNHYAANNMDGPEFEAISALKESLSSQIANEGGGDYISELRRLQEMLRGLQ